MPSACNDPLRRSEVSTPTLHTAREVGVIIKRHEQTVWRYRREGKLRGTPVGGGFRFSDKAIADFLAGETPTAKPKPSRNPKYSR